MKNYLKIIDKFVDEMKYKDNEHFLGVFFYGSSFTGFNNENSDIDLHIVFDNFDKTHIYRGIHYIDGHKIEYFEKYIDDLYLSVDNDIKDRNIAWNSMLANSLILYDKTAKLKLLQNYAKKAYAKGLPKLDKLDTLEYIAIINNRMEKLKSLSEENAEHFYHLYHLTIEKIRRFYHSLNGYPKINTTKIYKIYKNDEYRKSYYQGDFVNEDFKKVYFDLITTTSTNKLDLYKKLENFYNYAKNGVELPKENYKIKIKSRNTIYKTKRN